ncbi:hypothetical protein GA0115249_101659 [Streptomyces sp. PpalLS-921]|nr:hypothetical protein GA0115249_101659 [Streptomyces sp. PpalLS-921]
MVCSPHRGRPPPGNVAPGAVAVRGRCRAVRGSRIPVSRRPWSRRVQGGVHSDRKQGQRCPKRQHRAAPARSRPHPPGPFTPSSPPVVRFGPSLPSRPSPAHAAVTASPTARQALATAALRTPAQRGHATLSMMVIIFNCLEQVRPRGRISRAAVLHAPRPTPRSGGAGPRRGTVAGHPSRDQGRGGVKNPPRGPSRRRPKPIKRSRGSRARQARGNWATTNERPRTFTHELYRPVLPANKKSPFPPKGKQKRIGAQPHPMTGALRPRHPWARTGFRRVTLSSGRPLQHSDSRDSPSPSRARLTWPSPQASALPSRYSERDVTECTCQSQAVFRVP